MPRAISIFLHLVHLPLRIFHFFAEQPLLQCGRSMPFQFHVLHYIVFFVPHRSFQTSKHWTPLFGIDTGRAVSLQVRCNSMDRETVHLYLIDLYYRQSLYGSSHWEAPSLSQLKQCRKTKTFFFYSGTPDYFIICICTLVFANN